MMSQSMLAAVLYGAKDIRLEQRHEPVLEPGMVLVRVRRVGICGSDLHYYQHGYCAAFVPSRPFVLGHELAGEVVAAEGGAAKQIQVGARVTVNPTRPCGSCSYCLSGRQNLCKRIVMIGSASTDPPVDGAYAQFVVVHTGQCHFLPPTVDDSQGAMIKPFAVALHAVERAGGVSCKAVLVTGGGPIGLLVANTARVFGASFVAVSDVVAARRKAALQFGVDIAFDPGSAEFLKQAKEIVGEGFDVVFEASGVSAALRQAFDLVRPGGTIVQIGTVGTQDVALPVNQLMVREVNLVGTFRYNEVFDRAIQLVSAGRVNLKPYVSEVYPLQQVKVAFERAFAKAEILKVQLEVN